MSPRVADLVVFCASAAVLVLEILASRLLAPFIGVTLETYTAVIGVVLAGIALGAAWGGRLADRRDPRAVISTMLAAGGALALLTLPLVLFLGPILRGGGPLGVIVLAAVGFFPPAVALSAVPPAVAKLLLRDLHETGHVVGRLSAVGTAGARVGTFVTGFVLVSALSTRQTIAGIGLALVAGGLLARRGISPAEPAGPGGDARTYAALGLVGALLTGASHSPCVVESAYFCAEIWHDPDHPTRRLLVLDSLDHSEVDLADPTHLGFHYTRWFVAGIDSRWPAGEPLRALHIGGGGFTMPRYLAATRPGSFNEVLEIDPALVHLNEAQLGLRTGPDLTVRVGDARTTLTTLGDGTFDIVIGDAFGGLAVPWHLTTREFATQIRAKLAPGGLYLVNVIDGAPYRFARAEAETLRRVFRHVGLVTTAERLRGIGGNFVLLASDAPLPMSRAEELLAGEDDIVQLDVQPLADWSRGAMVLTDDHAPVDQLLNFRR